MNCKYCDKIISPSNNHFKTCVNYKKYIDTNLTKEFLEKEYIENGKSANEIGNQLNVKANLIIKKLKYFNIKTRSISEAKKMRRATEKAEKTNIERHGSRHNFCKNHPSRIEWELKMFENEGITNVFQRPEIVDKINIALEKNALLGLPGRFGSRISKPHKKVYERVQNNYDTSIKLEYCIDKNNIKRFYDIFLKEYNLILEINGTLWHGDPRKYKINDLISLPIGVKNVEDIWKYDKMKHDIAINENHHVLVIWETDINKYFDDVCGKINAVLKGTLDDKIKICEESRKYLKEV